MIVNTPIQQRINSVLGVNVIGMKRAGLSDADIQPVRKAFKILFRSGLTLPTALARIEEEHGQVLVVAEKLESVEFFQQQPELTLVPGFMVQGAAIVPHGAWPGSCWPLYEVDYPAVEAYMDTGSSLDGHMAQAPEIAERIHA